jgi:hypothetical protein
MDEGWEVELSRVCPDCKGTGKPPESLIPMNQRYGPAPPSDCQTCFGPDVPERIRGRQRLRVTFAKFREMLGS